MSPFTNTDVRHAAVTSDTPGASSFNSGVELSYSRVFNRGDTALRGAGCALVSALVSTYAISSGCRR